MAVFSERVFSENDFEAVLATDCCYDYGINTSEAVEKIATDQKYYHKCSLCLYFATQTKISSTTVKEVGYQDTFGVAKKTADVAQKKKQ